MTVSFTTSHGFSSWRKKMNLPENIKSQIKSAWTKIETPIQFILHHQNQERENFINFYETLSQLNSNISFSERESKGQLCLEIQKEYDPTGIVFQGIPLGHELSSFVLAPLVATHQAQMPDRTTIKRIKSLEGHIKLTSYISLSCENCPIVVQALNMMAAIHPDISHTMVDGALFPDEVNQLGILSVPSVQVNGRHFTTGRQDFSSLLSKLESQFSKPEQDFQLTHKEYEVVVVGSGPAGVSSAIYTARKGLKTAIVTENIGGLVRETKGIENLISTPFIEGPQLAENLKQHLNQYEVDIFENQRVENIELNDRKGLELKGGLKLHTKALIAATGAKWRELNVPGEKEYLGRGVAFCPHCDGPFYQGKVIAVIGGGNSGVEAALDLAGMCKKVTLFERGKSVKADRVLVDKLEANEKIEVITEAQTTEILGDGEKVVAMSYQNLRTGDSHEIALAGIFIQIGLTPNSNWIKDYVDTSPFGEIEINEKTSTSQDGIFAAGDVSTVPYKQIVVAMGEGAKAGLSAFEYCLRSE